jgi:hypothetical protein
MPTTGTDSGETPMTATYVSVMIIEALILVALWLFGRAFS